MVELVQSCMACPIQPIGLQYKHIKLAHLTQNEITYSIMNQSTLVEVD